MTDTTKTFSIRTDLLAQLVRITCGTDRPNLNVVAFRPGATSDAPGEIIACDGHCLAHVTHDQPIPAAFGVARMHLEMAIAAQDYVAVSHEMTKGRREQPWEVGYHHCEDSLSRQSRDLHFTVYEDDDRVVGIHLESREIIGHAVLMVRRHDITTSYPRVEQLIPKAPTTPPPEGIMLQGSYVAIAAAIGRAVCGRGLRVERWGGTTDPIMFTVGVPGQPQSARIVLMPMRDM